MGGLVKPIKSRALTKDVELKSCEILCGYMPCEEMFKNYGYDTNELDGGLL